MIMDNCPNCGCLLPDPIDTLAREIERVLAEHNGGRYESRRELAQWLFASGLAFQLGDLGPALDRLEASGIVRQDRPQAPGKRWPGRLIAWRASNTRPRARDGQAAS